MSKRTDSNSYTLLFSVGMVIVVGALLAFVSTSLKGRISENRRMEKQQNILYAMGVNRNEGTADVSFIPTSEVGEAFKKYIVKQLVIEKGKVTEDPEAYLIDLKQERSKPVSQQRFPLFIGERDGKTYYIVPVRGKGLWNAIWGYVAMDKNMIIQGVFFDHAGETPGLGANIKERFFMDDFSGEHLLDAQGHFKGVVVTKGNADPKNERKEDFKVDAIAGATITGNGLTAMLQTDLNYYVPYFQSLK